MNYIGRHILFTFCGCTEFMPRQYGEIEACKIGVDLRLHEFRALFERINAISIHELANTMKESVDFSNCYKYYLVCQGQIVSDGWC